MFQIGATSEDCLRDKPRSSNATNYLASFGRKFISIVMFFGLILEIV